MSRIADVLRKHRALALGASGAVDAAISSEADPAAWYPSEQEGSVEAAGSPVPQPGAVTTAEIPEAAPDVRARFDTASTAQLSRLVHRMLDTDPAGARVRSVLFTSVGPERSADFCGATAEALASHTSGSVCLVEGNLRHPSLHRGFGLPETPGLSDLLLRHTTLRACLVRVAANLWLLPAGTNAAEAAPALAGEAMRSSLREMVRTFDYVLVDTAAAVLHTDGLALAPLVDGVVLVIGANTTRREVARRIVDRLRGANAKVLGAVLANRDFPIPDRLYRML